MGKKRRGCPKEDGYPVRQSGGSNEPGIDGKTSEAASSLLAKLGNLVLTEKVQKGFVFADPTPSQTRVPKWSAVGKSFSPRPLNMYVLEGAMPRAWGLRKEAKFKDLGNNIFAVRFGSEGDWRHALNNGPWQFDFHVVVLKDYEGSTRPSEMVFDTVETWVRVADLPLDKRTKEFGEALGEWLGKVVRVDVEEDGFARGKYLRVRAKISVFEPLVRRFRLRSSQEDEEGTWYDFGYERIPHFCFECGRLFHENGVCEPPVESASQWGPWLRASPGRSSASLKESSSKGPMNSNSRGMSWTDDSENGNRNKASVRDHPVKRNLYRDFNPSADSRTGGGVRSEQPEVSSPNKQNTSYAKGKEKDLRDCLEQKREKDLRQELKQRQELRRQELKTNYASSRFEEQRQGHWVSGREYTPDRFGQRERRRGYYVRKPRKDEDRGRKDHQAHYERKKKRPPKQQWIVKGDSVRQVQNESFIRDTRQKTSNVFDRLEENNARSADPEKQGRRDQ